MRPVIGPDGNIVNPAGFWATYNQVFPNISKAPPPAGMWQQGAPPPPQQKFPVGPVNAMPLQLLAALAAQMWASSGMPAPGTLGGLNVGSFPGPRPASGGGGMSPQIRAGLRPMDPRVASWLAGGGIR